MELLIVGVLGLLGIAAATAIGPRLRVAAPLLLVVVGVLVSFLPFVPDVQIDPEWILAGVLPPLLYSASVAMPSMEFRREFSAIGGFSVVLVVLSAVVLGVVFAALIPGLGLAGGIALGAIVSPTDAVATSIVKRLGVSPRIVTVLEGESLLNDATALVLLRSAIAASAASVTFWDVAGDFLFAVAVALVFGYVVGKVNLWVRSKVTDATVNTVISIAVPFVASVPADALGASGLVAAVVAGLVTGRGAIRNLTPQHRQSDVQTWRTIELILEGGVFLLMGLEMSALLHELTNEQLGIHHGIGLALVALPAILLVRAAYVFPTLAIFAARTRRAAALRPKLTAAQQRLDDHDLAELAEDVADREAERHQRSRRHVPSDARIARLRTRLRRKVADLDYFLAVPLGWREGTVIVWAGMRGAVTLAAAQTLPEDTPVRSLLVITAFFVAAFSLIGQGGTLPWLVRVVKPAGVDHQAMAGERAEIRQLLRTVAEDVLRRRRGAADPASPAESAPVSDLVARVEREASAPARRPSEEEFRQLRLEIIAAQRDALLEARDDGIFSSEVLGRMLETLDADQISMELRNDGGGAS
ncbi:cation:proton antiporter [Agromyces aerolatus]|uniref:cation:proton antiporter n=1 Tax=Agromyces sp. LY-1074 TaxID=3074080 RepID=UPI002857A31B|nr:MULTISPECIES: sodium:proton antiporter [unclassified Agromyces]MDR5700034.1 sodium:proton antiporter [Agromyces sp. LY-1074]MDR5706598.1 sodium:proton antiporter [Agromyces sp. LY-1358]